ncbi:MAG: hypothetical protein ACKVIH_04085 [Burkholderiales bacterium]
MALADRINNLATRMGNYLRDSVMPRLLPSGGITGQVLAKTSATNYAAGWQTPSGCALAKSILSANQANSTVTPVVLTGCTFTLLPGQAISLQAILIFTAAATTTGAALGVRVAQGAGANANARGSWSLQIELSSAAAASGLRDGDRFDVAAGANSLGEVVGTASVAGNNSAVLQAVIQNPSTNANTTVTVEFRSEVAASAVTAQIGSGAVALIG